MEYFVKKFLKILETIYCQYRISIINNWYSKYKNLGKYEFNLNTNVRNTKNVIIFFIREKKIKFKIKIIFRWCTHKYDGWI